MYLTVFGGVVCMYIKENSAIHKRIHFKYDGMFLMPAPDMWLCLVKSTGLFQCSTGCSQLHQYGGLEDGPMISCSDVGGKWNIKATRTNMLLPSGSDFRLFPLFPCELWQQVFVCLADVLAYFQWWALARLPAPQSMPTWRDCLSWLLSPCPHPLCLLREVKTGFGELLNYLYVSPWELLGLLC